MDYRLLLVRALLLLPAGLLIYAGIKEASTTPWIWSSKPTDVFGVAYWVVSLSPFIVAVPAIVAGVWSLILTWRLTRQRFSVSPLFLAIGLLGVLIYVALLLGLSSRRPESTFAYSALFPQSVPSSSIDPAGPLAVTVLATLVFCGSALAGLFV